MTKVQMITQVNDLIENTPKLPKAFKESIESLLLNYKGSKGSGPSIEQIMEIDDIRYAWCNKHECYEITDNFRAGKAPREFQVLCKAAESELKHYTKLIHSQDVIMLSDEATPEVAFEALKEKKRLDVLRKGLYSLKDRPDDIEGYDYESEMIPLSDI